MRIGLRTAVGLGARVIQKLHIGGHTLIGAGSLGRDVPDAVLVYGAPAHDPYPTTGRALSMTVPTIPDLVSTIIPVYNRPEMVRVAVDSVLAQTWRPIEIILINDGSKDRTGEVLDALAAAHPEVIRVIHKDNGGPGWRARRGGRSRRESTSSIWTATTWLLPNKFADQVAALHAHPECGIAYGTSMYVNNDGSVIDPVSRWTGRTFADVFPVSGAPMVAHPHPAVPSCDLGCCRGLARQRPEDWDLEARMGALRPGLVHCGTTVSCQRDHPAL